MSLVRVECERADPNGRGSLGRVSLNQNNPAGGFGLFQSLKGALGCLTNFALYWWGYARRRAEALIGMNGAAFSMIGASVLTGTVTIGLAISTARSGRIHRTRLIAACVGLAVSGSVHAHEDASVDGTRCIVIPAIVATQQGFVDWCLLQPGIDHGLLCTAPYYNTYLVGGSSLCYSVPHEHPAVGEQCDLMAGGTSVWNSVGRSAVCPSGSNCVDSGNDEVLGGGGTGDIFSCVLDAIDTDGDGVSDDEDLDDDGDGVDDADDSCPTGGTGTDTDGDGCTDAEDDDDDGDGVGDLDDLCREESGPAANHGCPYVCGLDEAGGGQEPCEPCGEDEAPNDDGTECVFCEHGESWPEGSCEPDRCEGVSCGANSYCSRGACLCNEGFEDPDNDDVCTRECPAEQHDPDADGVCTRVCGYAETDPVAKTSLKAIPREPWEEGEAYECIGNIVVPTGRVSAQNDPNVCELAGMPSKTDDTKAFGHSHPYFTWDPALPPIECHGRLIHSAQEAQRWNEYGRNFSPGDEDYAESTGLPFYLVVPEWNIVKVYRPPEGCEGKGCPWRAWNL